MYICPECFGKGRKSMMAVPTTEKSDHIIFMVDNVSPLNLDSTVKEFLEVVNEEYYAWFAHYLINERATMEPNFHDLYFNFIEKINSRSLQREILNGTYEACKLILSSELIKSWEEASRLRNLGSWLGMLTIGKNQVLRAREIDPKSVIIMAYERGIMSTVMPFIVKLMEPCKTSLVYRPPNPWTMAILALLAEVYALPNLKFPLMIDIEHVFQNAGIDMKEVKSTQMLRNKQRQVQGNLDFSNQSYQPGNELAPKKKKMVQAEPSLKITKMVPPPSFQISPISLQNEMVLRRPPFQISTRNEMVLQPMPLVPVQFAFSPYSYVPEFPYHFPVYPPNFIYRM